MEISMKISGYHHIGLPVNDMEKSLRFYREGLGGELICEFPTGDSGAIVYMVDLGDNAVVELLPGGTGCEETNAHWAHAALTVDDARCAYRRALDAGAKSKIEPKDVRLGSMDVTIAFVYGPDGEVLEFFQVRS